MTTLHEYARRANQYRPTDSDALANEIRRLHATGLTRRDISSALKIDLVVVLHALSTDPLHIGDLE